ncbi:LysR substrate-binding domain-containing protein [Agrobacterium sp. B1(2019)]|uniref:LysR substrate-binding domain-containing protein n=1 Tax=Agrobacterium sp. B1(2019) TaxID=2607032 RepID=UPI0011EFCBE7|nr:LysR substrate-binding domain-containing protein [Agrobacterium sp. B1(2019)]TZG32168.1 hypothetical protein AGR1_24560 [Agrobacterium sp. B1(2019)]
MRPPVAAACNDLGLFQAPRYRIDDELRRGTLVEVLKEVPPPRLPVHALYLHTQQLSPRLRVFLDWLRKQYREGG